MKPLFLIGFMACGKTTLGRALAERHPWLEFVDLDEEVRVLMGCTAAEAFAAGHAAEFRTAESEALHMVATRQNVVVACGGGTPCFSDNMDTMLASGTVVHLVADADRTARRIEEAPSQRPLLAGLSGMELKTRITELLRQRLPVYRRAHHTFDSTYLDTPAEVEATCRRFAAALLP